MGRIRVVWSGLSIYAHGPKRNKDDINDAAEDRIPHVHHEHHTLHEEEEHRKDGDDDIEAGGTARVLAYGLEEPFVPGLTMTTKPRESWGSVCSLRRRIKSDSDWN